jgi:hypothetical protein
MTATEIREHFHNSTKVGFGEVRRLVDDRRERVPKYRAQGNGSGKW